jgi:hypothetical protein
MSGIGCIREGHTGSPEETREWMSGNNLRLVPPQPRDRAECGNAYGAAQ